MRAVSDVPSRSLPIAILEQGVEQAGTCAGEFALGQRMQAQDGHASGERVGKRGEEEHIGRSREQEAPRHSAVIDGGLDRREQLRHALYFVEDRPFWESVHEPHRILLGGEPHGVVVEGDVAVAAAFAHHAGEGGLAALPRTMNEDDGLSASAPRGGAGRAGVGWWSWRAAWSMVAQTGGWVLVQ
jgi:hypothetical protein